jgi:hypothetical protein
MPRTSAVALFRLAESSIRPKVALETPIREEASS